MDERKLRIIAHRDAPSSQILVRQEIKRFPIFLDHADKLRAAVLQDADDLTFRLMAAALQYAGQDQIVVHAQAQMFSGYIIADLVPVDKAESFGIDAQPALKITKAFRPLIPLFFIPRQRQFILQRVQFPHHLPMLRASLHMEMRADLLCAESMVRTLIHQLQYLLTHPDPLLS